MNRTAPAHLLITDDTLHAMKRELFTRIATSRPVIAAHIMLNPEHVKVEIRTWNWAGDEDRLVAAPSSPHEYSDQEMACTGRDPAFERYETRLRVSIKVPAHRCELSISVRRGQWTAPRDARLSDRCLAYPEYCDAEYRG